MRCEVNKALENATVTGPPFASRDGFICPSFPREVVCSAASLVGEVAAWVASHFSGPSGEAEVTDCLVCLVYSSNQAKLSALSHEVKKDAG